MALKLTVAVLSLSLVVVAAPAAAKTLSGSKRGDKLVGTKGADKIKGKGGSDKLKGKGGNDTLKGGKGRDKIKGGKGADRHLGGKGNDVLRAADGRLDKAINGGPGKDTCFIDTAVELAIVKGCETVQAGGPGGPGGTGPGSAGGLQVLSFSGLVCDTPLPLCVFTINGTGADALVGTVTGGGGVTGLGASVVITGPDWTAAGAYGCTADGFLRVTIGSESVDVPVDCTA